MQEGSSAQHANVYLRSRRIHIRDIVEDHIGYAYVVYVWTWRIGWSIGVRYIYLISVILNVYGGYDICFNTITHMVALLCLTIKILVRYMWFWFATYVSLRIEIPSGPPWTTWGVLQLAAVARYCSLKVIHSKLCFCRNNKRSIIIASSWGMSRRGRRDVEEDIVRDDIQGSRNLGSQDYWVRVLGEMGEAFL